jgi:hypothetical protein
MSQQLLDNWDSVPNRREADEQPATWLGSACVWGKAQSQGSKKGFVHPHTRHVVIVDDNDKALKSWRQEIIDAMQRSKPPQALNCGVAVSVHLRAQTQIHFNTKGS